MGQAMSRKVWIASLMAAALGAWSLMAVATPISRGSSAHAVRGYLGVELRDPSSKELSEQHPGVMHGTEIVRVDHDGPAGKAGLREHDVILQLNGQALGGQAQLRHMLHDTTPGQQVSLLILREGQEMTVTAQVADRDEVARRAWEQHIVVPAPDGVAGGGLPDSAADDGAVGTGRGFFHGAPMVEAPVRQRHGILSTVLGAPYTGLSLEVVTPQLGEFFGVQSGTGLLVRSVDANSPGLAAGLRAGDVVLKVNTMPMTTEAEWAKQMHELKGQPVGVLILRDRREQTVTITPDAKRRAGLRGGVSPNSDEAMLEESGTRVELARPA